MRNTISAIRRISLCALLLTGYVLQVAGQTTADSMEAVSTMGTVTDPATSVILTEEAQQEPVQELKQEKEDGSSMILCLVLIIALIAGVVLYVYKENRKLKQSLADMCKRIKEVETHVESLDTKVERQSSERVPLRIEKKEAAEPPCSTGALPVASSHSRQASRQLKPAKKTLFATIRIDNGKLSISHRSITDSPAGKMFQLSIVDGSDEGSYVISPNMTSEALNNLNALNDYVDFKRPSEKPTGIVTCKEGTIRKEDLDWVVTKKLEIKFKY